MPGIDAGVSGSSRSWCWVLALTLVGCAGLGWSLEEQGDVDFKVVSQCFRGNSPFSFVSLYCGYNQVIQIKQAFHGSHKNLQIDHCSLLSGDCTKDTTHMYNWAKCEGRHSCVQVMKQKEMPKCGESGTMQYLQVEYTCTEGTLTTSTVAPTMGTKPNTKAKNTEPDDGEKYNEKTKSTVTDLKKTTVSKMPSTKTAVTEEVEEDISLSICTNHTEKSHGVTVTSPGYPTHYLSDTDCRCIVQAEEGSKVTITYKDLGLVMRGKQCVDWLLVQSLGHKIPAAVTCGQLKGEPRSLVTKGNWALLHFHTATSGEPVDMDDGPAPQMKKVLPGFKIQIKSQPNEDFKLQCYTTHPSVLGSLRYKNGKHDATDNLILPATDLETIGKPGSLTSTDKKSGSSGVWAHSYLSQAFSLSLSAILLYYRCIIMIM